ncbi:hypothetical protein [Dinghuibacter silviterrae]|uniref:Uncharacterized protein n=1 Tax=Dinghuibacter silviterrae TaxID=1539049 RepID=A0A4R8DH09_9BACT|nr:hypothetical protein [Dinghuibacter silviterrae]TDW96981.1 hypothetical protein EDB95_4817 [Dinghuibacter silviterrae]
MKWLIRRRKPQHSSWKRGVNIQDIFQTFERVPDAGATYTLELCIALPVKNDPGASMNFSGWGLMAGHCFLILRKQNGPVAHSRSFGFYPARRLSFWKPLRPYPSCIRDNRLHRAHARTRMTISPQDFETVREAAFSASMSSYRLLDYNCADFALAVFNSVRAEPVVPPPYGVQCFGIPLGYNRLPSRKQMMIPQTPHGLYEVLGAADRLPNGVASGPEVTDRQHVSVRQNGLVAS